ncbi:MAG: response regulator [Anaerolineales bacterium]
MSFHVLVVDDNEVNLMLVAKILQMEGFETSTARCGREAIQCVVQGHPDLIILDINMPDLDGYTVCRRLREPPIGARMPIVMLSATVEESDRQSALQAGANDIISKPFDMEELRLRVRALLS